MMTIISVVLVLAGLAEWILRAQFGFCDAPLSILSDKYEYCFAPNQDRMRFGNRVRYNAHSMRSDEIRKDAWKVLLLGDSVVNGGVLLDQEELATTILTRRLTKRLGRPVQVLNISAGSWGPGNCAAFLKDKGLFDARGIIVALSGYDIQDSMSFDWEYYTNSVNKIHLPLRQYQTAIGELWFRYRKPAWSRIARFLRVPQQAQPTLSECRFDVEKGADPGYALLAAMASTANVPMVYCLHPLLDELRNQRYSDFSRETLALMSKLDVPVVHLMPGGLDADSYLDGIHLNAKGQARMAEILEPVVLDMLNRPTGTP